MRESDIVYENGNYWVGRDKGLGAYVVFKVGLTHSESDSAYGLNQDGLSIAIAYCNYLAKREESKS